MQIALFLGNVLGNVFAVLATYTNEFPHILYAMIFPIFTGMPVKSAHLLNFFSAATSTSSILV